MKNNKQSRKKRNNDKGKISNVKECLVKPEFGKSKAFKKPPVKI